MLRTIRQIVVGFFSGILFWLPSILIHAVRRSPPFGMSALDLPLVNILPIVATVGTVRQLARVSKSSWSAVGFLALHVAGIWILGPTCLLASASAGGGGSAQEGLASILDADFLLSPAGTFIGATYDATLGAVGFVTLALPVTILLQIWGRRDRRPKE
jgi:hypothetical protein